MIGRANRHSDRRLRATHDSAKTYEFGWRVWRPRNGSYYGKVPQYAWQMTHFPQYGLSGRSIDPLHGLLRVDALLERSHYQFSAAA